MLSKITQAPAYSRKVQEACQEKREKRQAKSDWWGRGKGGRKTTSFVFKKKKLHN